MTDSHGMRRTRLHGVPCPQCGQPAEGMHNLGPWTRIYHIHGWYCDLGGQPPSHFTYSQHDTPPPGAGRWSA